MLIITCGNSDKSAHNDCHITFDAFTASLQDIATKNQAKDHHVVNILL